MTSSLLSLFIPPKDHFGDFGMFCGYTASRQVLDRMRRNFSAETSRPVLAAFIHPTTAAVTDVPGLGWMWIKTDPVERGCDLLHAKVALMGFRQRGGEGYVIRLAVTTGNWTGDPLSTSIDLFWSIDVDCADPGLQDCADVRAAWDLFTWLRTKGDCSLIEREYDGRRPDDLLAEYVGRLPASDARPRFFDSRTKGLMPQVVARIGGSRRRDWLVVGSGYFEGGENLRDTVPERLEANLRGEGKLHSDSWRELVLNPDACQGLAKASGRLRENGWTLHVPQSRPHGAGAKLHAKFVLSATWKEKGPCAGSVYLGSGNMTPAGFERAASSGGNLEAGVVLDLPEGLTCREKGASSIYGLLPIGGAEIEEKAVLQGGPDFERPDEPDVLPQVAYLLWRGGTLSAPDEAVARVVGPDDVVATTPCAWPQTPPAFVSLAEGGWRVPVIAEGALVVPPPCDLTVEDILAGLSGFPEPAESDSDEDGAPGEEPVLIEGDQAQEAAPTTYALRRMMGLLARLSLVQAKTSERDWPRWCRELRQKLCAITEQEEAMLGYFRQAGADPLPVLLDQRMIPDGADKALLEAALRDVAARWKLETCASLWQKEVA
ncbi:hypothetical protein K3718_09975 [Leisingera aquaemixtae]|uniref:Phospholipase D-like domain-containing protein n=1 Tax=Leisingera aquaemixtae TaxID=1396826 RepID=A0ABY5WEM7_9RHOB|nr:hypothetical protein [Leisingera aquaemixtae]UWQ39916.1 hypothetical protein K3718_09975 [Leisingera aquaemixtae]